MLISREQFCPFEAGLQHEWLQSNGLGGFAASSVTGAASRYYHGLLVAARTPPVNRMVMLATLRERAGVIPDDCASLWVADRVREAVEDGLAKLLYMKTDPWPCYVYRLAGGLLYKEILPVYGYNAVYIRYSWAGEETLQLQVEPLCTFRDFHGFPVQEMPKLEYTTPQDNTLTVSNEERDSYTVEFGSGNTGEAASSFHLYHDAVSEAGIRYIKEIERGFKGIEDLAVPGYCSLKMKNGQQFSVLAWYKERPAFDVEEAARRELERQTNLLEAAGLGSSLPITEINTYRPQTLENALHRLVIAADKFLVRRESTKRFSLLAGYPWFADWGRDTMIALPGLTVSCGRLSEGREILQTFAANLDEGLLPNRFSDYGEDDAEYNTADASLWFFVGVRELVQNSSEESRRIAEEFLPVMDSILEAHCKGTKNDIMMDERDGLLSAGNAETQLTWMDARVDDRVITPRHGKAVEINALWYNALCIRDEIAEGIDQKQQYLSLARKVLKNYREKFWNVNKNCLYDVLRDNFRDETIRPNQIFALSLPYPLLSGSRAEAVFQRVTAELLTHYGLRSLSPHDEQFCPDFSGDYVKRDSAYHQGTVWSWLIGPYIFALFHVRGTGPLTLQTAEELIVPLLKHLDVWGIDSISENFDGVLPREGKGCFHQAWSVAELIRIIQFIRSRRR